MARPPPPRPLPVLFPDDQPLTAVLRAIRCAAAALEAGRSRDASAALCEAAHVIVLLHTQVDGIEGADEIARTFRWVAFRLKDADLLRDPRAARDAERAFLMLASGLRAGRAGLAARGLA